MVMHCCFVFLIEGALVLSSCMGFPDGVCAVFPDTDAFLLTDSFSLTVTFSLTVICGGSNGAK